MGGPKPPRVALTADERPRPGTPGKAAYLGPAGGLAGTDYAGRRRWTEQRRDCPPPGGERGYRAPLAPAQAELAGCHSGGSERGSPVHRRPRPGCPVQITAEQPCQMIALACEAPSPTSRPLSQWTSREIAEAITHRGIGDRMSPPMPRGCSNRGAEAAPDSGLADAAGRCTV